MSAATRQTRRVSTPTRAAVPFSIDFCAQQLDLRPKPLIQTLWGDSIVPHGGVASLASLVQAAQAMGVNERLTRMSMLRLANEGWFERVRLGRLSFYRMSAAQMARFQDFQPKVYEPPAQSWDGGWHVVIIASGKPDERLERSLDWLGLGRLAPEVFLCPADRLGSLVHVLRDTGWLDRTQLLEARALEALPTLFPLLLQRAWKLQELAEQYGVFLDVFRPALAWLQDLPRPPDPQEAFRLRTLLVHEWRRLALRDPRLPLPLLPADWPGAAAFSLTRTLYQRLLVSSETYLASVVETPDGPITLPALSLLPRFGGLSWSGSL